MYSFVDTTESEGTSYLPSEALSINGQYIENEIAGYRTLYVLGRELHETEIYEQEIGRSDGALYQGNRRPARTLTVGFQLLCSDASQFRSRFNQLSEILNVEEATLIFADETDKYWIGTPGGVGDVPAGSNSITSEFEIHCSDPRKYATTLKEVTASIVSGTMQATINNNGSVPVPISYEITNNHDNGYVGVISDQGVIQIGKIDEVDGYDFADNEVLMTQNNLTSASDDTSGTDAANTSYNNHGSMTTQYYPSYYGGASWTYLTMGNPGSTTSVPNGGMRTVTIPADSQGVYGCKNFSALLIACFECNGNVQQTGEMNINFLTGSNGLICSLKWIKNDATGGNYRFQIIDNNNNILQDNNVWILAQPFLRGTGRMSISKEGSKLKIGFGSGRVIMNGLSSVSFDVPAIKNMECKKVQVACRRMNTGSGGNLSYFGFADFRFTKVGVDKFMDMPNRYASGDVINIDGSTAKVYVNGLNRSEDIIVGSSFFLAPPGESTIKFAYSNFSSPAPTIKVRIREAWI